MTRWLLVLLLVLAFLWLRRTLSASRSRDGGAWDPHTVLGVPRGAERDVVTRAYRERMKEYHPDRVATLGPELQELAHRKTVEIQRAYEQLTRD